MGETMNIGGIDFNVIGEIENRAGQMMPMLEIPMMTDETWYRHVSEGARKRFVKAFGREPINNEEALDNEMESLEILSARYEAEKKKTER